MLDNEKKEKSTDLSEFLKKPIEYDISDNGKREGYAISPSILDYLEGKKSVAPSELSKMMADIGNKLAYFDAYMIIQRASGISKIVQYLDKIEEHIYSLNDDLKDVSNEVLEDRHKNLSSMLSKFLEVVGKFAVQSKNIIVDTERDEVVNLIRSLDSDSLLMFKQALISTITKKTGQSIDSPKSKT
jgi:hypothetical protein